MIVPRSSPGKLSALGQVIQVSYVPSDVAGAYDFWTRVMGVGPFFHMPDLHFPDLTVRGRPSAARISAGIAYWGDLQVEIIEVHDSLPSVYREWRDDGHEGVHHLCVAVSDIVAAREIVAAQGLEIVQEMSLGRGGKVCFVDTGGGPGTMIELLQMREGSAEMFDRWRLIAQDWAGDAPIRPAARPRS